MKCRRCGSETHCEKECNQQPNRQASPIADAVDQRAEAATHQPIDPYANLFGYVEDGSSALEAPLAGDVDDTPFAGIDYELVPSQHFLCSPSGSLLQIRFRLLTHGTAGTMISLKILRTRRQFQSSPIRQRHHRHRHRRHPPVLRTLMPQRTAITA